MVGQVTLSNPVETVTGRAAIFGPADNGFPDDGIIASGIMDKNMTLTAEINLEKLLFVRTQGQAHNFEDAKHCEYIMQHRLNLLHL